MTDKDSRREMQTTACGSTRSFKDNQTIRGIKNLDQGRAFQCHLCNEWGRKQHQCPLVKWPKHKHDEREWPQGNQRQQTSAGSSWSNVGSEDRDGMRAMVASNIRRRCYNCDDLGHNARD